MITLDSAPIGMNDEVYDLIYGHGYVVGYSDVAISVKFRNGRTILFDIGGRINGIRRLYWHDPLIIAPPKDKRLWDTFRPIITDIYRLVILRS